MESNHCKYSWAWCRNWEFEYSRFYQKRKRLWSWWNPVGSTEGNYEAKFSFISICGRRKRNSGSFTTRKKDFKILNRLTQLFNMHILQLVELSLTSSFTTANLQVEQKWKNDQGKWFISTKCLQAIIWGHLILKNNIMAYEIPTYSEEQVEAAKAKYGAKCLKILEVFPDEDTEEPSLFLIKKPSPSLVYLFKFKRVW